MLRTLSPNDAMFTEERHYFETGEKALGVIQDVLDFEPSRILDLPCGHGRVLRWLRSAYPQAQITACDLDKDGVDFCAQTFDASPVYGSDNLEEVELGTYDLIWCGSLFTHLDAPRWGEFLAFFRAHLDGMLVFTTLGPYMAELARQGDRYFRVQPDRREALVRSYDETGFGYAEYSGQPGYGQAVASPKWVLGQLEDFELVAYREQGWFPSQDVIAVRS